MNYLHNVYQTSLLENEKQLCFWKDYLQRLSALDFNIFADKLKVPALVPIGNRVLFKGILQHTNEVTVALGADYFAKCSIKQAEVLRQHRIKDAKSKLESLKKERQYIDTQLSFGDKSIFEDQGQNIIEHYTEEEDRLWREKHKDNVKAYKQKKVKDQDSKADITDDILWNRLEELEIQEELNNEQAFEQDCKYIDSEPPNPKPFVLDEYEEESNNSPVTLTEDKLQIETKAISKKKVTFTDVIEDRSSQISSKLDLLQKVVEKQHEIERQLQELKAKERTRSVTESDLITKLDEMEQLEELEDEIDRIDDVISNEDIEGARYIDDCDDDSQETAQTPVVQKGKGVLFQDDVELNDDSETINITFKHSKNEPSLESYDSKIGIQKPSDVYECYSTFFKETKSILKKSKYGPHNTADYIFTEPMKMENSVILEEEEEFTEQTSRNIVVKDVLENSGQSTNNKLEESKARPTSLFKMKRLQQKK